MIWATDIELLQEECNRKDENLNRLRATIQKLDGILAQNKNEIKNLKISRDKYQQQLEPTKKSLESMTAAHGKLIRKIKRQENTK
mgnify:CR=1 FL=1